MKEIIPLFVINLKIRSDRRQHILDQFYQKEEFDLHVVEACQNSSGALGLWKTITNILENMVNDETDYILICEDDHQFTKEYDKQHLFEIIYEAKKNAADILLGGISCVTSIIEITPNLFWLEKFTGLQFAIIFRKFFKSILCAQFGINDCADLKMGELAENKFFIQPFISIQKDFGYSDATLKNNEPGRVKEFFDNTIKTIAMLKKVNRFYQNDNNNLPIQTPQQSYSNIAIPTYIIKTTECIEQSTHIKKQFEGRSEFDITLVETVKHKIAGVKLWLSIRKVIKMAIENEDDVIIIREDTHEFTRYYSRDFLIRSIIESNEQRADFLCGETSDFQVAVPITKNRYWINPCLSTQFIIIYKRLFERILEEPFDDNVVRDKLLSEISSNKMVLFPFISTKKDFHYHDKTDLQNIPKTNMNTVFGDSFKRLGLIQSAYLKYKGITTHN